MAWSKAHPQRSRRYTCLTYDSRRTLGVAGKTYTEHDRRTQGRKIEASRSCDGTKRCKVCMEYGARLNALPNYLAVSIIP